MTDDHGIDLEEDTDLDVQDEDDEERTEDVEAAHADPGEVDEETHDGGRADEDVVREGEASDQGNPDAHRDDEPYT